ncbi:LiaI-LiaF-like domain-containing protein [Pontibacter sp. BAB1700]|uniref:LiaF transmembrane domain-containing protein n=1 Tax=Pontibacter sp. BAB1700 TaxID=1144253 RepID=UPI000685D0BA|nr:DUF5668 domain-containing protein [Pontibacter sp. BAB1700]
MKNQEYNRGGSGKMAGVFLLMVGVLLLTAKMGVFFLPSWVFSWPMFLIALGLFLGFKHSFQKPSWLVLIVIGGVFLLDRHFFLDINLKLYFWPILIIGLGLWLIMKPKKRNPWENQVGPGPNPRPEDTPGYYTDPVNGAILVATPTTPATKLIPPADMTVTRVIRQEGLKINWTVWRYSEA